ncbi:MAG: hypothetical protein ACR2KH_01660 [Sphingomicrobium sp.]
MQSMFNWLLKADKGADLFGRWFTFLTGLSFAYSWLVNNVRWFGQLNWAESILVGIGLALTTLFSVAASLALIRYFGPARMTDETTMTVTQATYDDSKLREEMAALIETSHSNIEILAAFARDAHEFSSKLAAIEELTGKIRDDYQRMNGLEIRFSDEMDKLKEVLQRDFETLRSNQAVLQERVGKAETEQRDASNKALHSLHAIYLRERLIKLAADIRRDAADLSHKVTERQPHDAASWASWQSVHSHWESLISQWWMVARFYLASSGHVVVAPDHMYSKIELDESTLVPIGGAEAVRVYKKFRIIQDQWEAVQDELEDNVCSVAFRGVSEVEARRGEPLEQG